MADRNRRVVVGMSPILDGNKGVPRHRAHRLENTGIFDAAAETLELLANHPGASLDLAAVCIHRCLKV